MCYIKESSSVVAESKVKQLLESRYVLVLRRGIVLKAAFHQGSRLPALDCSGLFFKVLKARGMTSLFIKKEKSLSCYLFNLHMLVNVFLMTARAPSFLSTA